MIGHRFVTKQGCFCKTHRDHKSLHFKGRESPMKGKPAPMLGRHHSGETKRKISDACRGRHRTEEEKKRISDANRGKHWFNNGVINVQGKECPDGFVPGRIGRGRFCSK